MANVLLSFKSLQFTPTCLLNSLSQDLVTPATLRAINSPFANLLGNVSGAVPKEALPITRHFRISGISKQDAPINRVVSGTSSSSQGTQKSEDKKQTSYSGMYGGREEFRILGKNLSRPKKSSRVSHQSSHPLSANPQPPVFRFESGPNQTLSMGQHHSNSEDSVDQYSSIHMKFSTPASPTCHAPIRSPVLSVTSDIRVSASLLLLLSSLPIEVRVAYTEAMRIAAASLAVHLRQEHTDHYVRPTVGQGSSDRLPMTERKHVMSGNAGVESIEKVRATGSEVGVIESKGQQEGIVDSQWVGSSMSTEIPSETVEKKVKKIRSIFDIVKSVRNICDQEIKMSGSLGHSKKGQAKLEKAQSRRDKMEQDKLSSHNKRKDPSDRKDTSDKKDTSDAQRVLHSIALSSSESKSGFSEALAPDPTDCPTTHPETEHISNHWEPLDIQIARTLAPSDMPMSKQKEVPDKKEEQVTPADVTRIEKQVPLKATTSEIEIISSKEKPQLRQSLSGLRIISVPQHFLKSLTPDFYTTLPSKHKTKEFLVFGELAGGAVPLSRHERTASGIGKVKSFIPASARVDRFISPIEVNGRMNSAHSESTRQYLVHRFR